MGARNGVRTLVGLGAAAALAAFASLGGVASAGSPNDALQVADLNPGAAPSPHLTAYVDGPQALTAAGDKVFFTASAGDGLELYVSDGTAAGTHITKDINPAPNASSNPSNLTAMGGTLYFQANDGTNGAELWRSDGTTAGTVMVKDINPSAGVSSTPTDLTNLNGILAFAADDGATGRELWRSDGTPTGTVQVGDLNPNPGGSNPAELNRVGDQVYFSALATTGTGLFRWDPGVTLALVQDISPGNGSDLLERITDVNGVAYFRANDGSNGTELWKTNSTGTSAAMVEDLNPLAASGNPTGLAAIGSKIYF